MSKIVLKKISRLFTKVCPKIFGIMMTFVISFSSLISVFPIEKAQAYQVVGVENIGNVMSDSTDLLYRETFTDEEGTAIYYDVDDTFNIKITQISANGEVIWQNKNIDITGLGIDPYGPAKYHDYIITDGDGGVFIFGSKVVDYGDNDLYSTNNIRNIQVVHVLADGTIDSTFPQQFMPSLFDQEILAAWPDYQGGFGIFYESRPMSDFRYEYRLQHVSSDGALLFEVEEYVDLPEVNMHCTNEDFSTSTQIPEELETYYSYYGWKECWEWCETTMDDAHPFCEYTAEDENSCWVVGAPSGDISNCTWDTLSNSLGNKWPTFYGVKQDLLPITIAEEIIMEPYAQTSSVVGILAGESSEYNPTYNPEYSLDLKDAKFLADGDLQVMLEKHLSYETNFPVSILVQQYDSVTFAPKYPGMGIEYFGETAVTDQYTVEYNGKLLGDDGWYVTQLRDNDLDGNKEQLSISRYDFDGDQIWQNIYEYSPNNDVYTFSYDPLYTSLSNLVVDTDNNLIMAWVVYDWFESDYFLMSFYQKYNLEDGSGLWGTFPNELVSQEYSVGNMLWEFLLSPDGDNGAFISFYADEGGWLGDFMMSRINKDGVFDDFNQTVFVGPWASNTVSTFKGLTGDGLFVLSGTGNLDLFRLKLSNQVRVDDGYSAYSDEVNDFVDTTTQVGVTKDDNNFQNKIRLFNNSYLVTSLYADMSTDRDWTNVIAQSSEDLQKAFVSGFDSTDGNYLFHDLYVPYNDQLPLAVRAIVCPGAGDYDSISRDCVGGYSVTTEQTVNPLSLVSYSGNSYWKVPNLTGTGVMLENSASFEIIPSATQVAPAEEISLTVRVLDLDGAVDTSYLGEVSFSSQIGAILPANYTFTSADQGVHTFTGIKFNQVGTYNVMVTDQFDQALSSVSQNIISSDPTWQNGEEDPDIVIPVEDRETVIIDPSCATNTQRVECQTELLISNVEIIDNSTIEDNYDRTICWDTNIESQGSISYGTDNTEYYEFTTPAENSFVVNNHCINLNQLQNNNRYFFKISSISYAGKESEYSGYFDIGTYQGEEIDQPKDFIIVEEDEVISQSEAYVDAEGLLDLNLDLQFMTPREASCYLKYGLSLNDLSRQSDVNTVGTVHNYSINLEDLTFEDRVYYEAYCQQTGEDDQAINDTLYLKRGAIEMVQIDNVEEQKTVTITVMLGLLLIGLISIVLLLSAYLKITKKKSL